MQGTATVSFRPILRNSAEAVPCGSCGAGNAHRH